jgi:O-antigen ligase
MAAISVARIRSVASLPEASRSIASSLAHAAVSFLLFVSVTAPVVTVSSNLPWFRVEQLALVPIGIIYLWLLMAGLAGLVRFNGLFWIAAVYCGFIFLSLFAGTFVLGHAFTYRDFYEIPKALFPVVFFVIGLEAALSERAIGRILRIFAAAIVPVCLYAWAQWMDLGISRALGHLYSGGAHDEGALAHYRRVFSTTGNPNILGQLMTWAIAAFTLALLLRVGNRIANLFLVLACLVTLAMTGSRYGLIDTGLVLILIVGLSFSVKHRRRTLLALLIVLLPVFIWITIAVARTNQATLDRFQTLSNPLQADSLRGRLDDLWPDANKEFFSSPLLGHGPAKTIFSDIVTDSEYLDVLKEFGILGFLVYLGYFIYPLRYLWRGLKYTSRLGAAFDLRLPATVWALHFSFVVLITGLVMNIGMSTFYSAPLQGFFWLWIGIGVSAARKIANEAPNYLCVTTWA